jgi:hypothetical protein
MHPQGFPVPSLVHCIYSSQSTHDFTVEELTALLANAREANARQGISGMLLHCDGSFFQILEGERAAVDAVFERIANDPRHTRVTRIIHEPIPRRFFGDWTMGFAGTDPAELEAIEGLNDFFDQGRCLADIDAGRSRKLLQAFRAGRWRARLAPALAASAA